MIRTMVRNYLEEQLVEAISLGLLISVGDIEAILKSQRGLRKYHPKSMAAMSVASILIVNEIFGNRKMDEGMKLFLDGLVEKLRKESPEVGIDIETEPLNPWAQ